VPRRLFIPGTGGCFFHDPAGNAVGSVLDLALDHQRDFVCQHDPDPNVLAPLHTSGRKDAAGRPLELTAAGPIRAVYTPFFDQVHPASTRKVYTFYNYDWRLDLRFNGARLWHLLETSGEGQPWDIVCHSQGGFLLAWASILAGPAQFRRFVRRVVCFGVALQGTVNAVEALLDGFTLAPQIAASAATVRSWPSIYMMMPRWRLRVPGTTGIEIFKSSTWKNAQRLAPGSDLGQGISESLLRRAQAWKAALDNQTFDALCNIERLVFVQGDNINTRARAPAFPRLPDVGRQDGELVVRGDGLVPMDLTLSLLPHALRNHIDSIVTPVPSHIWMCSDQNQLDLCERIFHS